MRTNVTFLHPAEFVRLSDEDGILAVGGATWFADILQRIPGVRIDGDLCQEDWGVVTFVERAKKRFWVGLSLWPAGENAWLAHFHHGSFAWFQWFSASGQAELRRLLVDFHHVLKAEPLVSGIAWYAEREIDNPSARSSSTPIDE